MRWQHSRGSLLSLHPTPHPAQPEVRIPAYGSQGWLTFPIHSGSSHLPDMPIELKLCRGAPGTGQLL